MRANPAFDTEKGDSGTGHRRGVDLFLDAKGSPSVVERAMVIAPCSRMGPVTEDERNGLINHLRCMASTRDDVDRESAYEMLQKAYRPVPSSKNNPPRKGKR
ncbi:helicase HerA-like domain-containing protein [Escherichia coli]